MHLALTVGYRPLQLGRETILVQPGASRDVLNLQVLRHVPGGIGTTGGEQHHTMPGLLMLPDSRHRMREKGMSDVDLKQLRHFGMNLIDMAACVGYKYLLHDGFGIRQIQVVHQAKPSAQRHITQADLTPLPVHPDGRAARGFVDHGVIEVKKGNSGYAHGYAISHKCSGNPVLRLNHTVRRTGLAAVVVLVLTQVSWALGGGIPRLDPSRNTIRKADFNFGHQLGYLYARPDTAYIDSQYGFEFETGLQLYHTPHMPRVTNPAWQRYSLWTLPLGLKYSVAGRISLQVNSDAILQWPMLNAHSLGGNSPRVRAKVLLLDDRRWWPALALTVGVKFSSAKPWTIWYSRHNYRDSNGLAGPDTGVADYLLLLHVSKAMARSSAWQHWLHLNVGLAPLGDPTAYEHASSQADEIPFRLGYQALLRRRWDMALETAGMLGILSTTSLDKYAVARIAAGYRWGPHGLYINAERGLTATSDTWVGGLWYRVRFGRSPGSGGAEPAPQQRANQDPGIGAAGDPHQATGDPRHD